VIISAKRFHRLAKLIESAKLSESLAEMEMPLIIMLEGNEQISWTRLATALT